MTILFLLLAGHAVADFPLQGEYLAKWKNRYVADYTGPTIWPWCLWAHAFIHGGFVTMTTGSVVLGLLETVAHAFIDFSKGEGWIDFHADQALHVGCKFVWWGIAG